ncbi:MAG TPA: DUF4105 domain-containing protein [Chitinophagales bacterium]|nr:DUF4105 domain-containing protein [Chitinophagales bacterium]
MSIYFCHLSRRIKVLALALFLFPLFSLANGIVLSDSARVSLLTVAPGSELYSAFGHTGIRVTDYKNKFDVVFNYGTFDFAQPGFYTNFVKGKMRYMIAYERFDDFLNSYYYEKRSVTEQQLRLSAAEMQSVFAFLYNNAKPENREYYYDFFWDNCSTRPRDVFEKTLGNRLKYHTDSGGFEVNKTMHDMLRVYVHDRPWVDFGFDLILGLPCEVIATPRHQTFLPEYLLKYADCATVDGQPFVTKKEVLVQFPRATGDAGFTPMQLCQLLALIGLMLAFAERLKHTHYYGYDFSVFFIAGLLGTIFLLLGIFTSHYSLPKNMNMLWLIPTHLVVSFVLLKKQKPVWLKYYFVATFVLMLAILVGWAWMPQPYSPAARWLIVLLGFRAISIAAHLHTAHKQTP